MRMTTIRHARLEDASAIAAIWNPMIRDTIATFTTAERSPIDVAEIMTRRIVDGHPWIVAEADDGLSGFATCSAFRPGPGYARTLEHTIVLSTACTRRGLGARIMDRLAQDARASGANSLIGAISAENARALAFHAAQGFVEVGRIPDAGRKFDRWHSLVLVQRRL